MQKTLLIFISSLLSLNTMALTLKDDRGMVEIDLNSTWKYEKNLLGLPHVLLSPGGKQKTTVSVTITGLSGISLPSNDLKRTQPQYQQERKKWAEERHLSIQKFYPYELRLTKENQNVHVIGLEYKIQDTQYSEKSYYVECPESLIHLKSLGISGSISTIEADRIASSVKCGPI